MQCSYQTSEGMRAVLADRELQLKEKLVGRRVFGAELDATVLTAQKAELARHVGDEQRAPGVADGGIGRPIRPVESRTNRPAACHLIVTRHVVAERVLLTGRLIALAPDQLRPSDEGVIDGALQRTPAQSGVDAIELRDEPRAVGSEPGVVVAVRVRATDVDVGAFAQVLIPANVPDVAQIAARARLEKIAG